MSDNTYKILIGVCIFVIVGVAGVLVYFSFFAPKNTSVQGGPLTPTPTPVVITDVPSGTTDTPTPSISVTPSNDVGV